ncbi:MAG: hypothetical protein E6R04_00440 [Spirochaetes bacterium]|nr:MAG: hypothetical protein E6R04_00440 [Spirochaetota bacterium]
MYTNINNFYDKIDNEGGMYEAVTNYGLKPKDLDSKKYPEIHEKFMEFCEAASELADIEDEITSLMYAAMDEEEDD